ALVPVHSVDVLFYIVLNGGLTLAMKGGRTVQLGPADVAMVFGGIEHHIGTAENGVQVPFAYFRTKHDNDVPSLVKIGKGGKMSRFLAGRVAISWPIALHPAGLPACLKQHMASYDSG